MSQQSKELNQQPIDINGFRRIPSDTGSSEVQIAQITSRMKYLTSHFKTHKKDFHSQTGLIKMISRRRKLLAYLKKNNFERYQFVIHQLGLRK